MIISLKSPSSSSFYLVGTHDLVWSCETHNPEWSLARPPWKSCHSYVAGGSFNILRFAVVHVHHDIHAVQLHKALPRAWLTALDVWRASPRCGPYCWPPTNTTHLFCGDVVIDLWRSYNLIYNYALPTDRSRRSLLMFTHLTKHNSSITVPGVRKWKVWAWAMSPTPMNTQTPTEHKRSKPSNVCPLRPNMLPIDPHADMATLFSVIRIDGKRLLIPQYTYVYIQTW